MASLIRRSLEEKRETEKLDASALHRNAYRVNQLMKEQKKNFGSIMEEFKDGAEGLKKGDVLKQVEAYLASDWKVYKGDKNRMIKHLILELISIHDKEHFNSKVLYIYVCGE
jgi:hypothetical protein